jgi:hypothetical protein
MDQIDLVADQLRLKGCEIRQILKLSGVITGRVDKATHLDALRIEGISSIEKQRMVRKK